MSTKLRTVDAETLLATPLKPVPFIVDGLIPRGLHILAGSPKIGKSWLVLWLCLKVAEGEPVWGRTVNHCSVLYLCLEDTYNRIQNRLFEITDTATSNLHFTVMAEVLGFGLEQQITAFLKQEPETKLIVIDTLQRIRCVDISSNAYANDYKDICELKKLADKHSIAIILVHHLRKHSDKDPFNMVSGTTGITGGVDTTYVLEKDKRSDNTAKLYVTGRDVEYLELSLQFENCLWECLSCANSDKVKKREAPGFILQTICFMAGRKEWCGSATKLLQEMSDTITAVNIVTKLLNQYYDALAENGVEYRYYRTGKSRLIRLKGDGYDSCDSAIPPGKQPSQPSSTVTLGGSNGGAGDIPCHTPCLQGLVLLQPLFIVVARSVCCNVADRSSC